MPLDILLALILFAALLVGTPGPANILVMAAGAKWGVQRCIPFIIGLIGGKLFLNALMGAGLLTLLDGQPLFANVLRVVSAIYLLWLAWKITRIQLTPNAVKQTSAIIPGFFAGLIVHPLNPKAWAMSVSAYSQFANIEANWLWQSMIIMIVFFATQAVMHPLWCYSGQKIVEKLSNKTREQLLMNTLAASVVLLALWSVFFSR